MEEFLKKTSAKPAWSALKRKIKTWETPKLLGLVKDLSVLPADNQDFLAARLPVETLAVSWPDAGSRWFSTADAAFTLPKPGVEVEHRSIKKSNHR